MRKNLWPRRPSLSLAVVALLGWVGRSSEAHALDTEVTASVAAQGYALRSPFGDPILMRRRVMNTLGLGVYHTMDSERPTGAQILVKLRLRLDADVGIESNELNFRRGDPASRYVPGLLEAPVDLMYGYVEGRNFAGGWLGFRLGRQYVSDALGWWSFDGGLVRLQAPYVHVEAYGGFEQRGGLPLSLGRYERNGVWRGDRQQGLDGSPDAFGMFLEAGKAPAFGVALESAGPHWIHGRLDYRRVYNTGAVAASYLPGPGGQLRTFHETRTSSERLGYAIDGTVGDYGAGKGGVVYDLYNQFFSSYYVNVDGFVTQRVTVGADWDYFRPTFDGDSIFNWFTQTPITTLTGRGAWQVNDQLDLALNGGVRWWATDDDPGSPTTLPPGEGGRASDQGALADPRAEKTGRLTDALGSAHGRYRWSTGKATLRGVFEVGERGRREGVDVGGERYFRGGKYGATLRGSLFDWRDELRPDRSATSVGYVVGGIWRPGPMADVLLEWEHNMNRLVGQRYRVLAVVNVAVNR
jgi:hypothetical protein